MGPKSPRQPRDFPPDHGRILDFAEVRGEPANSARVTVEVWLEVDNRLVFRDEFTASEAIGDGGTKAAVEGLSRGLARVVAMVAGRLREVAEGLESPATTPGR